MTAINWMDGKVINQYYYTCSQCEHIAWDLHPIYNHYCPGWGAPMFSLCDATERVPRYKKRSEQPHIRMLMYLRDRFSEWTIEVHCLECDSGWKGNQGGMYRLFGNDFRCPECGKRLDVDISGRISEILKQLRNGTL